MPAAHANPSYPTDPFQLDHQSEQDEQDDLPTEQELLHERHHIAEVMLRARFHQKKMRAQYA